MKNSSDDDALLPKPQTVRYLVDIDMNEDSFSGYRWCKKCNDIKPPRTHHCSVCSMCVMRMDHHCPWTGNCIGLMNYKYFMCFLFYQILGGAFYVYSTQYINFQLYYEGYIPNSYYSLSYYHYVDPW